MSLVLKEPFRSVVVDGTLQEIKVTQAPLQTLRDAIDQDEIVSLRAVMRGMLSLMHYPYHTTKYDIRTYVHDHFDALVDKVGHGEITAYTDPDNAHYWEMYYLRTKDLLDAFDVNEMPSKGGFEVYSHHNQNLLNQDNLYVRDFRRAFLVAIGDAKPQRAAFEQGDLSVYQDRTEQEWGEYLERREEIRRPARPQMQVWPWAQRMWDALEKYDINPDPNRNKSHKNNEDDSDNNHDFEA